MLKNGSIKLLLLPVLIMIADLIIKAWLVDTLPQGGSMPMVEGVIDIQRITTNRMAFGSRTLPYIMESIRIAFQIAFVVFFMKVLRANVHRSFTLASAMIVAGWIGLYLDRFLFSIPDSGYLYQDYIIIANNFVTSLTTLMIMIGWMLLLFSMITRIKEVRAIFKRA